MPGCVDEPGQCRSLALLRHSKIADGDSAPSTRPRQRRPHPAADPRSPEIEKATETGRSVRVLLARPGAKRHVVNGKPPTLDSSTQAIDRAIRSSPPNGHPAHHPWGCWIFAGRAARSRSNNLVISTTEQHTALPYQGSGGSPPRGGLRHVGIERAVDLWVGVWVGT